MDVPFSALGPAPLCGGTCQPSPKTHTPHGYEGVTCVAEEVPTPSDLLNLSLQRFSVLLYSSRTGHRHGCLSWNTNSQCLWRSVFHSILGCEQGANLFCSQAMETEIAQGEGWGTLALTAEELIHCFSIWGHLMSVSDRIWWKTKVFSLMDKFLFWWTKLIFQHITYFQKHKCWKEEVFFFEKVTGSHPCHSSLEGGEILTSQHKALWIKLIHSLNSQKTSREISLSLNGLNWTPAEWYRSIKFRWRNINKQPWNWKWQLGQLFFKEVVVESVAERHLADVSEIQKALIWNFAPSWCQRPHPWQHSCKSKYKHLGHVSFLLTWCGRKWKWLIIMLNKSLL